MAEPALDLEQVVTNIWCTLLNLPQVVPTDNFLDLGGNSLRAGEVAARLRRDLGIDVPIDVVLSEETLASFLGAVQEMMRRVHAPDASRADPV